MDKHELKKQLRRAVYVGARVADTFAAIGSVSPASIAAMGLKAADSLFGDSEKWIGHHLSGAWELCESPCGYLVYDVICLDPAHEVVDHDTSGKIVKIKAPGGGYLAAYYNHGIDVADVFSRGLTQPVSQVIARYLWERLGGAISVTGSGTTIRLEPDVLTGVGSLSAPMLKLKETISRYRQHDQPIAIMLYGAPGVGKSTTVRTIAKELHGTTLRVRADQIAQVGGLMMSVIQMLRPTILIMDDLDHADEHLTLISTLEPLRRLTSVIMATANSLDFHPALLRPGRFDLVELVEQDQELVELLSSSLHPSLRERAEGLPIAHLQELERVQKILGLSAALERADLYVEQERLLAELSYPPHEEL